MKKFGYIVLYCLSILALSWFLPWLYALVSSSSSREPFASFSPVAEQWVVSVNDDSGNTDIYTLDSLGERDRTFTKTQRDSLLPQLYYKDLLAKELLPDSIGTHEVTLPFLRHAEFAFTSNRRDVNKVLPQVYLMMESMPERADLEDPDHVFRFRDGRMEFLRMADNTVNESRTRRFTDAMNAAGFIMPASDASANITARKLYDEGYLMIDADGKVFHVKQRAGRPYVSAVRLPDGVRGKKVFIFENTDERILGFMTDSDNIPYFILKDGLKAVRLGIGKVNPSADRINIMGNLFNIVFRVASDTATVWSAVDADTFETLGRFSYSTVPENRLASYIFPYRLNFNSSNDSFAYPRISGFSMNAIWLNLVLAVAAFIILRRVNRPRRIVLSCLTVVFGIYIFVPLIFIK